MLKKSNSDVQLVFQQYSDSDHIFVHFHWSHIFQQQKSQHNFHYGLQGFGLLLHNSVCFVDLYEKLKSTTSCCANETFACWHFVFFVCFLCFLC